MANQKKTAPDISNEIRTELSKLDTMSGKIRYLASKRFSTADISRILTKNEGREVRYQWVRNVLNQKVKGK